MRVWAVKFSELCGGFRQLGVPYLGVLIIRTLLFKVLYLDPLFSETPMSQHSLKSSISSARGPPSAPVFRMSG